jgi:cell division protein FtsA
MSKGNLVTVLDLGSTKAVCLAVESDADGQVKVVGMGTEPMRGVRRGVVAEIDEAARSIDNAVRKVQQMIGQEVGSLIVGIGGTHLEGVISQGFVPIYPRSRSITREDVLQVVNHSRQHILPPDREQIQAIPREFRIDGQRDIPRPIGMSGGRLEVVTYLVTGQVTHVQNIEKALSMGGRKVEQMVLQPLASGLGVLTQEELELNSVVVDIGGGVTDVGIFSKGSILHSACLPIGGQLVTSDLSKLLKTTPEEAERLKTRFGAACARLVSESESVDVMQLGQTQARPLQRRVLCEIIESRMRELAQMVRQQIERSGLVGMLPGGVVLTGGGSLLPGSDKLFEEVLKHVRVRTAEPGIGGSFSSAEIPNGMAAAVGLARFAIQCGEDDLAPASGVGTWKERIRGIKALFGK